MIVDDFNTPFSGIYMSSRQKLRNAEANWPHNQNVPSRYSRTFHPNTNEPAFTALHGTFFQTDHMYWHKASLNRYKKIEIRPCILPGHPCIETGY